MKRIALFLIATFSLSGCMTTVNSNVTRFHDPNVLEANKTFAILPLETQDGSLEFQQYAKIVSEKLQTYGYTETSPKKADYAVFFNYGIDNGSTVISSYPIYGSTGGGTTYHSGSVNTYGSYGGSYGTYNGTSYTAPTFGVVGSGTSSHTEYTRVLNLDILDAKKSNQSKIVKVFEGKVKSTGSSASFSTVSQCLIDSLFKDFPGENGKSESIALSGDTCMKKE